MNDPIKTIESEVERLTGSGVLPVQETLTIRDAVARIRSEGGIEFRPTGRGILADEAGSAEWQASKAGGSKIELIRTRQEAHDRLLQARIERNRYENAVRSGERAPCADTRHSLRMAILEAERATLEAYLAG